MCVRLSSLPTMVFFTSIDRSVRWLVLSEVQSFSWMDFTTNPLAKVFIWNNTISIDIEFIKKFIKCTIRYFDSPISNHIFKFLWRYLSSFIHIQRSESFSQSFPLKSHFRNNKLFEFTHVWIDISLVNALNSAIKFV